MRQNKEPTATSLVMAELQGADDFRSVKQLRGATGQCSNRITAALHHLHKRKCVDFISDTNGVWWYATPETDTRCRCVDQRTPEVKPRKQRKPVTRKVRFCEFTGDAKHAWDEVGHKRKCPHLGLMQRCLLHSKPLGELEGWPVCCPECTTPVQVKEVQHGQL